MLQEFFPVLDGVPMGELWILLIWGFVIFSVGMFALWLWHFKAGNAGVVDFGWAGGLGFLGAFYAFKADGYGPRRLLMGSMVFLWGARLAWHILSDRILGGKPEDPRYQAIRERWKNHIGIKFLFFFEFQAVLAVVLSFPFPLFAVGVLPGDSGWDWLGFVLLVVRPCGGVC